MFDSGVANGFSVANTVHPPEEAAYLVLMCELFVESVGSHVVD
jgi:hypothetical protein